MSARVQTVAVDFRPNRESLAWSAGFFDGEGHVHFGVRRTRRGTAVRQIGISVAQSDRERLDHLASALGVGVVRGPYRPTNERARPYHVWGAGTFELVQHVGAALWSWLGPAKREQFRTALTSWCTFVPDVALCDHGSTRLRCRPCRSEWTTRSWTTRRAGVST